MSAPRLRYEVQTCFGIDSWQNCWTIDDVPVAYNSRQEAEDAIDDHLAEIEDAVAEGFMEEMYDREDYRVVEVTEVGKLSTEDGDEPTAVDCDEEVQAECTIRVDTLDWHGVLVEVRYISDWVSGGFIAHLELESIEPARAALPVTETGYRSHFLAPEIIEQAGGPTAYALAWLEAEAKSQGWIEQEMAARQYSLF